MAKNFYSYASFAKMMHMVKIFRTSVKMSTGYAKASKGAAKMVYDLSVSGVSADFFVPSMQCSSRF